MTQQNVTQIKRGECLLRYTQFPITISEDEYFFPESINDYRVSAGASFAMFIRELGIGELIFLGDLDIPWRYRDSDALAYLVAHGVTKRFNGGLRVSVDELPVFFMHLACLVATNTVLPIVHFMDHQQRLVGSICRYGNVHLSILDKEMDEKVVGAIENAGLTIVSSC